MEKKLRMKGSIQSYDAYDSIQYSHCKDMLEILENERKNSPKSSDQLNVMEI